MMDVKNLYLRGCKVVNIDKLKIQLNIFTLIQIIFMVNNFQSFLYYMYIEQDLI